MKRRDFLKSIGAVTAGVSLPMVSTKLYANHDGYTGPLWLTIDARGGWDPTSLCDPKGTTDLNDNTRVNNYLESAIQQPMIGATPANSPIRFAPPPSGFVQPANPVFSNQQFFDRHYSDLLIINGIDVKTLSHRDGAQHSWSGDFGGVAYPNIGAMIAGLLTPNRSMPFITSGGYSRGAGVVVPVRVNGASGRSLNAVYEMAFPSRSGQARNSTANYLPQAAIDRIKQYHSGRNTTLDTEESLTRVRDALSQFRATKGISTHLDELGTELASTNNLAFSDPASPNYDAALDARNTAQSLYLQGRFALSAFKAGVCAASHISMGGFDTHSNHDASHYPRLMDFLQGIDAIIRHAEMIGVRDRLVVVITSEFGRTNKYNNGNGKDHWPITSMMLMGNNSQVIQGNRVIGGSTPITDVDGAFKRMNIDRTTLQAVDKDTPNSVRLTPAHIHRSLRRLAGISGTATDAQFRLEGEDLDLL